MASHCIMSLYVLTCMFFFFFCTTSSAAPYEKVKVDLYYETMCPGCADFMVNAVPIIFQTGLIHIVHLNLVPYGNAKLDYNGNITCQHGKDECYLNTVEACAIYTWPDVNTHYKFLQCIESWVIDSQDTPWEPCYEVTGLNPSPVIDCTHSQLGKELEVGYAKETNSLVPPHKFLPWVVVNGIPLKENYPEFMTFVCVAYKGPTPGACKNLLPAVVSEVKKLKFKQVCPVKDTAFSWLPLASPGIMDTTGQPLKPALT
ncbi:hypothetical protein ACHQM5_009402 [Ranunculus cassubicifolius]